MKVLDNMTAYSLITTAPFNMHFRNIRVYRNITNISNWNIKILLIFSVQPQCFPRHWRASIQSFLLHDRLRYQGELTLSPSDLTRPLVFPGEKISSSLHQQEVVSVYRSGHTHRGSLHRGGNIFRMWVLIALVSLITDQLCHPRWIFEGEWTN